MLNRSIFNISILFLGLLMVPNATGFTHASDIDLYYPPATHIRHDDFDQHLYKNIRSIDALVNYIENNFKGEKNSFEFVNYIGTVISHRFYHNFSFYTTDDNWIAGLAGKLVREDVAAIVIPEDIMKFPNAACSQQSIVLMECARRFGLDYRKVSFDHHYAVEIKVKNKWHYVDTNIEVITKNESLDQLIKTGRFFLLYRTRIPENDIKMYLAHPRYGKVNAEPAPQAAAFQRFTSWMSDYFFCILFFLEACFLYLYTTRQRAGSPPFGSSVIHL